MKWNTNGNKFIAFFDIMGFKDFIYRNTHEDVRNRMEKIFETIKPLKRNAKNLLASDEIDINSEEYTDYGFIRPIVFSDSVVFVSNSENKHDASGMILAATYFLTSCIQKSIPVKGAITYGLMNSDFNKSLHFGKPLIDAYLLQDELSFYGCILDSTSESKLLELNLLKDDFVYKYGAPLKSGKINHFVLNWVDIYETQTLEDSGSAVEKMYLTVCGKPRLYVDNTINFVKEIKRKNLKKK